MSNKVLVGAVAIGTILAIVIARRAGGFGCKNLENTMEYYYLTYIGPSQTFMAALGDCYDVIYTIEVWDAEMNVYWPPANPMADIIQKGAKCRVMAQEPCVLCNFS